MINRLIILMIVCLMSFGAAASAGSQETKEGDNLPPLVIETDNLTYAGAIIDWDSSPSITTRDKVNLYAEPSLNSEQIATTLANEKLKIVGVKAYIYPRMGTTIVTVPVEQIKFPYEWNNISKTAFPQKGDTIYVIYLAPPDDIGVAWYKGHFIPISPTSSNGIQIPYLKTYLKSTDDVWAVYKGYVNPKDNNQNIYYLKNTTGSDPRVFGSSYRRNADIWLQVELPDKTTGWVMIRNAHLGASEQPFWWENTNGISLSLYSSQVYSNWYRTYGYIGDKQNDYTNIGK